MNSRATKLWQLMQVSGIVFVAASSLANVGPVCDDLRFTFYQQVSSEYAPFFDGENKGICGPVCLVNGSIGVEKMLGKESLRPAAKMQILADYYQSKLSEHIAYGTPSWVLGDVGYHLFQRIGLGQIERGTFRAAGEWQQAKIWLEGSSAGVRGKPAIAFVSIIAVSADGRNLGGHVLTVSNFDAQRGVMEVIDPNYPATRMQVKILTPGDPGEVRVQIPNELGYLGATGNQWTDHFALNVVTGFRFLDFPESKNSRPKEENVEKPNENERPYAKRPTPESAMVVTEQNLNERWFRILTSQNGVSKLTRELDNLKLVDPGNGIVEITSTGDIGRLKEFIGSLSDAYRALRDRGGRQFLGQDTIPLDGEARIEFMKVLDRTMARLMQL